MSHDINDFAEDYHLYFANEMASRHRISDEMSGNTAISFDIDENRR